MFALSHSPLMVAGSALNPPETIGSGKSGRACCTRLSNAQETDVRSTDIASDGSCVAKFCEHDQPVKRVAFLLDGKSLVSATMDGAVAVRRLEYTIDSVERY